MLYARIGIPYCPIHGIAIESQTIQQMVDKVMAMEERTKIQIFAPVIRGRKGTHKKLIEEISKKVMHVYRLMAKYMMLPTKLI